MNLEQAAPRASSLTDRRTEARLGVRRIPMNSRHVRTLFPLTLVVGGCASPNIPNPRFEARRQVSRIEAPRSETPSGRTARDARALQRDRDGLASEARGTADSRRDLLGISGGLDAQGYGALFADFGDRGLHPSGDVRDPGSPAGRRSALPGFWQTVHRDLTAWPDVFWEDTKAVFGDRGNLVILGLTYGASLAVRETGPDDTVEHSFRKHSTFQQDWRDAFAFLGNPGTHFGLAGLWYLAGQRGQDERTYQVGTKLFRALAVTGVTTLLGQAATWDHSPNGEWGTLPSGHTASTFALASVMHHEYGPLSGVPLYALGTLVGYSRLEDGEHYLSDVLMGGVLGLVIGHTLAADGQPPTLLGGRLVPYVDPPTQSTGIAWVKSVR